MKNKPSNKQVRAFNNLSTQNVHPLSLYLDNQDLKQHLHISDRTLQQWRTRHLVRYTKIGRKIYYHLHDVQKLFETHSH